MQHLSIEHFEKCLKEIVEISDKVMDGWKINKKKDYENGLFITKKQSRSMKDSCDDNNQQILVTTEYHVAYHISYGVPVLCLMAWKQDGSLLTIEDIWRFTDDNHKMFDTLTQMDHPVLCKPFFMLHPCKTNEMIQPFLQRSKNPVISWLSLVGPFVHMDLTEEYLKHC